MSRNSPIYPFSLAPRTGQPCAEKWAVLAANLMRITLRHTEEGRMSWSDAAQAAEALRKELRRRHRLKLPFPPAEAPRGVFSLPDEESF